MIRQVILLQPPVFILLVVIQIAPLARAQSLSVEPAPDPATGGAIFEAYAPEMGGDFFRPPVHLSKRDLEAIRLSEGWQDRHLPATLGDHGKVIYHFGESSASVVAAPGNVTRIELEPGEVLVSDGIFIGDTVNWKVLPTAQGGKDRPLVTQIIVKPNYPDLETTMIIVTDRRTYHFHLKSTQERYMTAIGFDYPEIEQRFWKQYFTSVNAQTTETLSKEQIVVADEPETRNIGALDFDYQIAGQAPWKPLRVYNDGTHVYIQMPASMQESDAPIFQVLSTEKQAEIVNYRLRNGTFVIDKLFRRGLLLAGTGRSQQKVEIEYVGVSK